MLLTCFTVSLFAACLVVNRTDAENRLHLDWLKSKDRELVDIRPAGEEDGIIRVQVNFHLRKFIELVSSVWIVR